MVWMPKIWLDWWAISQRLFITTTRETNENYLHLSFENIKQLTDTAGVVETENKRSQYSEPTQTRKEARRTA